MEPENFKYFYFLHIPKTSGVKMQHQLLDASNNPNAINHPKVYCPGDFEFVFDADIAKTYNIISGHFARNPIEILPKVATFTIIRDPVQQYLSVAKYAAMFRGEEFTEEFMMPFLTGESEMYSYFEGMSGCSNPQSSFISSKLSTLEYDLNGKDRTVFIKKPESFEDVRGHLSGMVIGVMEQRDELVQKVNILLKKMFNISIREDDSIVNATPPVNFKISKECINLILDRTELDRELHAKVLENKGHLFFP
jgi:NACalpha-BTF3-like transcription factor